MVIYLVFLKLFKIILLQIPDENSEEPPHSLPTETSSLNASAAWTIDLLFI